MPSVGWHLLHPVGSVGSHNASIVEAGPRCGAYPKPRRIVAQLQPWRLRQGRLVPRNEGVMHIIEPHEKDQIVFHVIEIAGYDKPHRSWYFRSNELAEQFTIQAKKKGLRCVNNGAVYIATVFESLEEVNDLINHTQVQAE